MKRSKERDIASRRALKIVCEKEILGKNFCAYGTRKNPWFLASDVAWWLKYRHNSTATAAMVRLVSEDNKKIASTYRFSKEHKIKMWFINEEGIYQIILRSRQPIAAQLCWEAEKLLSNGECGDKTLLEILKGLKVA